MTPSILSQAARERRRRAIGHTLTQLRQGLNQTELGVKLGTYQPNGQPIPQTTVSRWERGTVDLTFEQALEIEVALGLTPGTLFKAGGYEAPSKDDSVKSIKEMIRDDSNLDPEFRQDVIRFYESYVQATQRLRREESVAQAAAPAAASRSRRRVS